MLTAKIDNDIIKPNQYKGDNFMEKISAKQFLLSKEIIDKTLQPVKINFNPIDKYKNHSLHFAMNAGIEISEKGRLFTCWIGGEDGPESYMIVTYSDDMGDTWKDMQFVIDPHTDDVPYSMNTHVGGLWRDPDGKMWLFFQQSYGMWDGGGAVFALVCDEPDAPIPVWNEPYQITPGAVIKKPIVLSNGEWLLPVSVWERWHISAPLEDCHHEYDDIRGANVFASKDKGKTWEYRGGVIFKDSCFNEHSIVELSNGDIMMISRCDKCIKRSFSSDYGKTWSEEEKYFDHLKQWSSMATLRKLSSGNLLLVKHGVTMQDITDTRSHLTAFISKDDGKTWLGGLLLDERDGVSYPDICEGTDGTIFVQYDYMRHQKAQLLFARFKEDDVLAKETVTENSALCRIITSHQGITGTPYTLFDGAADCFTEGNGTAENPFKISDAEHFIYLAKRVYSGDMCADIHFLQTNDIDFGGREIVPVGSFYRSFSGIYNGGNHYLKNFKVTGYHIFDRAPFGCLYGATIKNVKVSDAIIKAKGSAAGIAGSVVGTRDKKGIIKNCCVENNVNITAYMNIGGIVGNLREHTEIIGCENNAILNIPRTTEGRKILAGGIAGATEKNTVIIDCVNHGNISARFSNEISVGGIAGGENTSEISNCENNGNISLDMALGKAYIGGICGKLSSDAEVSDCLNNGSFDIKYAELALKSDISNYFVEEKIDD